MSQSLDPRVNRLPNIAQVTPKAPLDQFGTYEVFVQPREGKPFQHEGCVHAPNLEMAFVLAKETFTRRFTCVSLMVVETRQIYVSPMTDENSNVYSLFDGPAEGEQRRESFEIFHLLKRGKQHVFFTQVEAGSYRDAVLRAKQTVAPNVIVYNIWVIRTADIRYTRPEESDLWTTLPEKKFRDASAYKAGEKLKDFTEKK